ncbi:MAG: 1-phosphofructokinase family hexose kinase [Beutenbergiaceae bacterium]
MIITLTPNPALDLTYHLDSLKPGASHRAPAAQVRAGGKGLNVARVLHSQSYPVHAVIPVGGDPGQRLLEDLQRSGIPFSCITTTGLTRSTTALVTPSETTNINEQGTALPTQTWQELTRLTLEVVAAHSGDGPVVLVCSGSWPPGSSPQVLTELIVSARAAGARTIIDASGPQLIAAAQAGADILKPNQQELRAATGDDDPVRAARDLAARGDASTVYVSLGADGLMRVPAQGPVLHARLSHALCGNTTGAGDAAVAALASMLAQPCLDPAQTLRTATAWSAAAVLHPLAGEIQEPQALLADITIEALG